MRHPCYAIGCTKRCRKRHLMCKEHWTLVPESLRVVVYETASRRAKGIDASWAPWWRAAHAAIAHVVTVTDDWTQAHADEYLAEKHAFADRLEAA